MLSLSATERLASCPHSLYYVLFATTLFSIVQKKRAETIGRPLDGS